MEMSTISLHYVEPATTIMSVAVEGFVCSSNVGNENATLMVEEVNSIEHNSDEETLWLQ